MIIFIIIIYILVILFLPLVYVKKNIKHDEIIYKMNSIGLYPKNIKYISNGILFDNIDLPYDFSYFTGELHRKDVGSLLLKDYRIKVGKKYLQITQGNISFADLDDHYVYSIGHLKSTIKYLSFQ